MNAEGRTQIFEGYQRMTLQGNASTAMDHAWIIERFGGVRSMAKALGHRWPTTVQAWKSRKIIPLRQIPAVLIAAKAARFRLGYADFFKPPTNVRLAPKRAKRSA